MRRIVITLMSFSLVATCSAFAQDDVEVSTDNQEAGISANQQGVNEQGVSEQGTSQPGVIEQGVNDQNIQTTNQPGTAESTGVSVAPAPAPEKKKGLVDEKVGLKPQIGDVNYIDASGGRSNRALYGATVDFNMSSFVNKELETSATGLFLGPSTGFLFSHIGAVGAGYLGDSGAQGGTQGIPNSDPGANMFIVPADLKAGWTVDKWRVSAHGGGNVIYRSSAASVQVGKNTPITTNSKWGILPNAGADLEYGVVNGAALILRPDWTFGGSNTLFTGTVGLSIPIS